MDLSNYVKSKYTLKILNNENIFTPIDVLNTFPIKYINYEIIERDGIYQDKIMIECRIVSESRIKRYKNKLSSLSFDVISLNNKIEVIIFNRDFLKNKILMNNIVYVYGKYDYYHRQIVADNIFFQRQSDVELIYQKPINKNISYIALSILKKYDKADLIPKELRTKYKLIDVRTKYKYAHDPKTYNQVKEFYRREKYEELFLFELMLEYKRLIKQKEYKSPKKYDLEKVKSFINTLEFELTDDQKSCVNDIFRDLKSNYAANRLIQGDVGSGKTIVCALAIYAVITAGYQAALMAPTEILANQHYENLKRVFNNLINIELLTSSIKGKKREEIISRLKNNEIDLLIGTHALITENVEFNNLGIVVTDEQHRFGVLQRQALKNKGINPDVLFLSATPIPRTLAISLFGDMDLSIIKTKPNGRKPVITKNVSFDQIEISYNMIEEELKKGHQAYVVVPLIENEDSDLSDISKIYTDLEKRFSYKIGVLHGKMKPKEKDQIMLDFKNKKIDILLSTTVIEVGVDVYNATIIVIYNGERFGLSQLHQLRGRVGRNHYDNYCVIISKSREIERLRIIESTYDGFKLAEEDLRLRGPGDFFGSKQSGMPSFKVANLVDDFRILELAKIDASEIIKQIDDEKYSDLLEYLKQKQSNIE